MISTAYTAIDQSQVVIRALSSITSEQASRIAEIIQASRLAWDVQSIDNYDGYRSILIEPALKCDEQNAFFISGTAQSLELFKICNDNLTLVETFADVEALGASHWLGSLACDNF